jgi:hypothetical protein
LKFMSVYRVAFVFFVPMEDGGRARRIHGTLLIAPSLTWWLPISPAVQRKYVHHQGFDAEDRHK